MVDVGALDDGYVVGEQLQGHGEEDGVEYFGAARHVDDLATAVAFEADAFVGENVEFAAPGADLGEV